MSAFLAIFAREFRLRRILLLGAVAIGLMAQIIPRLQGESGTFAAESASAAALLLGLLTCSIYALILGSGAIARDLADGRLGFDFVRPIQGFSIWAGRIGAALGILSVSALLVGGPALLSGPARYGVAGPGVGWLPALDAAGAFTVGLLACGVLFFLAHGVTVFLASRSATLGFDFAGLLAVGVLVETALSRLHRNWALDALGVGAISFSAFLLVVLIGASLVQILVGRTDLARSHKALSLALWGPLLLGALALEGASRWVLSPGLSDLKRVVTLFQAPAGTWFAVGGDLRGRGALSGQFLIDAVTGRVVRQGLTLSNVSIRPGFSDDGKIVAWINRLPRGSEVRWVDLSAPKPEVRTAPITFEGLAEVPTLSPTGRRIALRSDRRLLVFELRTGRLLSSIPITSDWDALRIRWITDDRLRFWSAGGNVGASFDPRISIGDLAVMGNPGTEPTSIGTIPLGVHGYAWDVSLDGETVIVRETGTGLRKLFDGRTGAVLSEINEAGRTGGVLLSDGSVAIQVRGPGLLSFAVYDRRGILRRRFDLRGKRGLLFGAQPTPTKILASAVAENAPLDPFARHLLLLDLATGGSREVGRGFIPSPETTISGVTVVQIGPAAFARWDPKTESLKPIVPR
ncbi:MAG: hypothetical protein ABJC13_25000 [Acidobacteriota bacterium]